MRVWKCSTLLLAAALATTGYCEENRRPATKAQSRHMVDMADGLNTQDFYNETNPDGIWSSDLKTPWAKSTAINAYEENEHATDKAEGTAQEESLGKAAASGTAGQVAGSKATGTVKGKAVDADQLVNIRVLYTLNPENSRASFSPVSAQNELFRQMSRTCSNGFQKVAEWSEPVSGDDYYLYYQFKCMPKR